MTKPDGERIAILETGMQILDKKVDAVDKSITSLHTKIDTLIISLSKDYVAIATFEEYKRSRWMERLTTVLITAIITGLVAFFIQQRI